MNKEGTQIKSPVLYLQHHYELLKLEYEYEKEQFQQQTELMGIGRKIKRGMCWYPLSLGRSYYNALNQLVIEVERKEDKEIEHLFEYGKPVCFFTQDMSGKLTYLNFVATVNYVEEDRMVVILPDANALLTLQSKEVVGVQLYFDETSYRLMFEALKQVISAKNNRLAELRDIFHGTQPVSTFSFQPVRFPWLNATQDEAVNKVLHAKDVAIVHGPPGTGKTTLSTDPKRLLIGDDEHGWDDNGVFNFEGGCYAKVINLDKDSEPDIYNAIRRDALLENVTLDENGKIDFADKSVTENTRVSYPINHIQNIVRPISSAPAAKNVIFLSADAFGVLPPVSVLTPEQTQYYFLSGFTAKLAGTERGITEPTPTFSACFGQAFLELHPTKYAEELVKKMEKSGAKAYLVNTGWNGTGKRISIKDTRGIIDAILNGDIKTAPTKTIPYFNFEVPTELPGVDPAILDPRDTYADASEWEVKAKDLAARFVKNFAKYEGNEAGKALVAAGPQA